MDFVKGEIGTLKNEDFLRVFSEGRRFRGSSITLYHMRAQRCRVGIVVSKRVKNAVVRNRIRRRFREVIRQGISQTSNNAEQVWVLQPEVAEMPFHALIQEFHRLLNSISTE